MTQTKILLSTLLAAAALAVPAHAATQLLTSSDPNYNSDSDTATYTYDLSGYESLSSSDANTACDSYDFYFNNSTLTGNIVVGSTDSSVDGSSTGVAITNANNGTTTLSGSVSGDGVLLFLYGSAYGTTVYDFAGDLSDFSGTIITRSYTLISSRPNTFTFSGTSTDAVAGTGAIISDYTVNFAVSSGDVTVANSSITALNLTFSGADYTVTGDVTGTGSGALTISSGVEFQGSVSGFATVTSTGTITNSGTLDLSGATVSLSSAITNTGTVTVDTSTVFDLTDSLLSDDEDSTTYVVISGGTIEGWTSLTTDNITLDGAEIDTASRTTYDFSTAGTIVVSASAADLIWAGTTSSSVWDTTTQNWTNNSSSDTFYSNDNVTFDSTAESTTVTVESAITAGTISVNADYTFSIASGASVTADSLTVASDSTLTLSGSGTLSTETLDTTGTVTVSEGATLALTDEFGTTSTAASVSLENISGAGTVEVALAANYDNTLAVSTSFTGTTVVTSGCFTLTGSGFGGTLELADGVNAQITDATTVSADLVIDGTSQIHLNNSNTLTLDGSLTGDGTFDKRGGGTLVIAGGAEIGAISIYAGSVTFSSDSTVGTISTTSSNNNYTRYITIDDGVTVTATSLTNNWGLGSLTVNGTLDVETLTFSTGSNASTTTNVITGSGTISATTFYVGNVGTYNVNGGIRLELGSGGLAQNPASSATSQTVNLGDATLASTTDDWSSSIALTLTDSDTGTTFEAAEDTTITLSGVLSGDGALNKTGTGTLTLSGTNTYTGDTTVSAGTLVAASSSALGTGDVSVASDATLSVTADLTIASDYTIAGTLEVGDVTLTVSDGASLTVDVASVSIGDSGELAVASGGTLDLGSADSESYSLNVTGEGTVSFESTNTKFNSGVKLGSDFTGDFYYTGNYNPNQSSAGSGTLHLSDGTMWVGSGSISNTVVFETDYTIGDSGTSTITFSGEVSAADDATVSIGTSTGTTTVTFSDTVTIETLEIGASAAVTLSADSAITNLTIDNGGTLTVADGVTLTAEAVAIAVSAEADAILSGDGSISSDVTITLTFDEELANAIAAAAESEEDYSAIIVVADGNIASSLSTTNFDVSSLGVTVDLSYSDGSLTISLTAVPEPSAFGLLAGTLALALAASRRRRTRKA